MCGGGGVAMQQRKGQQARTQTCEGSINIHSVYGQHALSLHK